MFIFLTFSLYEKKIVFNLNGFTFEIIQCLRRILPSFKV